MGMDDIIVQLERDMAVLNAKLDDVRAELYAVKHNHKVRLEGLEAKAAKATEDEPDTLLGKLGPVSFAELVKTGMATHFYDLAVSKMSRDELMAVIGYCDNLVGKL